MQTVPVPGTSYVLIVRVSIWPSTKSYALYVSVISAAVVFPVFANAAEAGHAASSALDGVTVSVSLETGAGTVLPYHGNTWRCAPLGVFTPVPDTLETF